MRNFLSYHYQCFMGTRILCAWTHTIFELHINLFNIKPEGNGNHSNSIVISVHIMALKMGCKHNYLNNHNSRIRMPFKLQWILVTFYVQSKQQSDTLDAITANKEKPLFQQTSNRHMENALQFIEWFYWIVNLNIEFLLIICVLFC